MGIVASNKVTSSTSILYTGGTAFTLIVEEDDEEEAVRIDMTNWGKMRIASTLREIGKVAIVNCKSLEQAVNTTQNTSDYWKGSPEIFRDDHCRFLWQVQCPQEALLAHIVTFDSTSYCLSSAEQKVGNNINNANVTFILPYGI